MGAAPSTKACFLHFVYETLVSLVCEVILTCFEQERFDEIVLHNIDSFLTTTCCHSGTLHLDEVQLEALFGEKVLQLIANIISSEQRIGEGTVFVFTILSIPERRIDEREAGFCVEEVPCVLALVTKMWEAKR